MERNGRSSEHSTPTSNPKGIFSGQNDPLSEQKGGASDLKAAFLEQKASSSAQKQVNSEQEAIRCRISRHRRPHPHVEFRDCRRHSTRQHRPQLRPAPHPAPRRSLRTHAWFSRTVFLQTRGRPRRHDGRCLPRNPRAPKYVEEVIQREEESFNKTLDRGIAT